MAALSVQMLFIFCLFSSLLLRTVDAGGLTLTRQFTQLLTTHSLLLSRSRFGGKMKGGCDSPLKLVDSFSHKHKMHILSVCFFLSAIKPEI